ncbi:hypothetical protein A4X09_0g6255 [Tilletia walkeri]|uniref:Uncharacterized protein n=1 Tax=Tilletia walkeri TaxID=117179 RepID=A0A8X7N5E1_9BASI|nr:hypothetical protein A4X09_0g6255 [Tilletia walkeri]
MQHTNIVLRPHQSSPPTSHLPTYSGPVTISPTSATTGAAFDRKRIKLAGEEALIVLALRPKHSKQWSLKGDRWLHAGALDTASTFNILVERGSEEATGLPHMDVLSSMFNARHGLAILRHIAKLPLSAPRSHLQPTISSCRTTSMPPVATWTEAVSVPPARTRPRRRVPYSAKPDEATGNNPHRSHEQWGHHSCQTSTVDRNLDVFQMATRIHGAISDSICRTQAQRKRRGHFCGSPALTPPFSVCTRCDPGGEDAKLATCIPPPSVPSGPGRRRVGPF